MSMYPFLAKRIRDQQRINNNQFMTTQQVIISASPEQVDILLAELGEIHFDIFEDSDTGLIAYCQTDLFDLALFSEVIKRYEVLGPISFEINSLPASAFGHSIITFIFNELNNFIILIYFLFIIIRKINVNVFISFFYFFTISLCCLF